MVKAKGKGAAKTPAAKSRKKNELTIVSEPRRGKAKKAKTNGAGSDDLAAVLDKANSGLSKETLRELEELAKDVEQDIEETLDALRTEQDRLAKDTSEKSSSALKVRGDALDEAAQSYEKQPETAFDAIRKHYDEQITQAGAMLKELDERLKAAHASVDATVAQGCRRYKNLLDKSVGNLSSA